MPQPIDLSNRIILITGAGSGIGKALSLAASQAGATVALCGRNVNNLASTYDEIVAAGGTEPLITPLNLETCGYDEVKAIADALESQFGRLDGLVINAAQMGEHTPVELAKPRLFAQTLHINLNSQFFLIHTLLTVLKKSDDAVCLLSGDEAANGRAFAGGYGVAKAGLASLFEMLHNEMGSSIRFNRVEPGPVSTNLRLQTFPGEEQDHLSTPEQAAQLYLTALAANSGIASGEVIRA